MKEPPYSLADLDEIWAEHRDVLQCFWVNDECRDFTDSPVSALLSEYNAALMNIYWMSYAHASKDVPLGELRAWFIALYAANRTAKHWETRFKMDTANSTRWFARITCALFKDDALDAIEYSAHTVLRFSTELRVVRGHRQGGSSS